VSAGRPDHTDLIHRLRTRAAIRRQIPGRKSQAEGKPDRLADLLEEAAEALEGSENASPCPSVGKGR